MSRFLFVLILASVSLSEAIAAEGIAVWSPQWTMSRVGGVSQWFEISGTGSRNNPLRRKLASPFEGDQLFVRFELRYDATCIDTPGAGNGEFLVLWLDEIDGGDGAVHNGGVPNVGVHVDGDRNAFMARYASSTQTFADVNFEGDRVYTLVARLSRSEPGKGNAYDRLALWVDPKVTDVQRPAINVASKNAIRSVRWIGFATGLKTEVDDRISVSEISLATSWHEAFGLEPFYEPELETPPSSVPPIESTVNFATEILPLLKRHCFGCHAGEAAESGVRLDSFDELLNQVVPRDSDASHLIALIESTDPATRMPPPDRDVEPIGSNAIATLRKWIDEGVAWDHEVLPAPSVQLDSWAFQPFHSPEVPVTQRTHWTRTPVDAFIAASQERRGIAVNQTASWPTLQRRIALDLTGLPPSAFPGLEKATSHEQLDDWIEQLLSTPQHAERWGRFWLDLARWAESNGYQHNRPRPHAWRYRDYVIESFHQDKPYDQFILEQLAGDELPGEHQELAATGFLSAARYSGNELDKEIQRNDLLNDVVNTTAKTFLGVTLECAQCHTHKFDPFTIRDYYRFQAFFTRGQPGNLLLARDHPQAESWIDMRWRIFDSVHARMVHQKRRSGVPEPVLVIPKSVVAGMNPQERTLFRELDAAIDDLPQVWGWSGSDSDTIIAPHEMRWPLSRDREAVSGLRTYLRLRGDVKSIGPEVAPGWPSVFGPTPKHVRSRTDLARWMTSPENPLTARVWVNRIWQWHFGTGIVESSGDFGTQGTPPTHPALLDWLAQQLIHSGWSTRHIHRLITRSSTYRLSSAGSPANQAVDPDCETLWRWTPRRLESEAIRDSVLAVAGTLDRTIGGPSVADDASRAVFRRSAYLQQQRERIAESLTLFDSPPAVATCSRRRVSTVALQPLYLLNSDFMQVASLAMAERVRERLGDGSTRDAPSPAENDRPAQAGAIAIRIALGREATADEVKKTNEYLREHSLESLCLAILNLSEFLYLN